jgi:hypothetical protein
VRMDQGVLSLVVKGKAHSIELLRLDNVVSQALTSDKACDRIAETALIASVAESISCLLIAPRLCRKLLSTEGCLDRSGYSLLLQGIVLPDVYAIACEMPPSIRYDASLIATATVEPLMTRRCTRWLIW